MSVAAPLELRPSDETPSRHRVLIVTSSYLPTMIADMHRARHLAWELPKLGWDVEILAPDQSYQPPSCIDDDSGAFFPASTRVTLVRAFLPRLFRRLGAGTIGWRAIVPMFFAGNKLLRDRIDIVYFSTTQFSLFLLGPLWRLLFRVPYVLDFHDPCVKEGRARPEWMQNFSLKYALTRRVLQADEAVSTRRASALVSVSPGYVDLLSRRHAARRPEWTKPGRAAVIPFAAFDHDLAEAASGHKPCAVTKPSIRVVYVGAGGPIMARAFALFCKALASARAAAPDVVEGLRVELYGTVLGWEQRGGRKHLAEIAEGWNLGDIVQELPGRVSYRRSLELLLGADGALIFGVDDAGYMPSKLFCYALSGKPLLAVIRRDGPAFPMFQGDLRLGEILWFDETNTIPPDAAASAVVRFLGECGRHRGVDRRSSIDAFLAPAMARRHAELFEACLSNH